MNTRGAEPRPRNHRTALWALLVVVVVLWQARPAISFHFVAWDDELNLLVNPHLGPPTARNVGWMFTDFSYMRRYVPFGWLGFSVAYSFSGLSPVAYHFFNVVLHATNALLLYFLIIWILRRWSTPPPDTYIAPCAAIAALFWAIHPLRAETVGWASGLLYTLSCFFALLSVLAYCGSLNSTPRCAAVVWRWSAVLLYAVSLLTYPITIGLMVVFLGIAVVERRRSARVLAPEGTLSLWRLCLRQTPFVMAALAVTTVTVVARMTSGPFWGSAPNLEELGWVNRVVRGFCALAYYLEKTLLPVNLTPLPTQLDGFSPISLLAVASVFVICGITWAFWRTRETRSGGLMLWVCYLILLAPMLGFTEKVYHTSDRYSYLPSMAGSVALAGVLVALSRRFLKVAGLIATIVLLALVKLSSAQLQIWRDTPSLFARCVEASTSTRLTGDIYQRWANFHSFRGQVPEATAVIARAEQHGLPPLLREEMAANLAQAREQIATGSPPLVARIHADIALNVAKQGRTREADEQFAAALRIAPHSTSIHYSQAMYAAAHDDPRRALASMLTATAQPNHALDLAAVREGWRSIAQSFARANEPGMALHAEARALQQRQL